MPRSRSRSRSPASSDEEYERNRSRSADPVSNSDSDHNESARREPSPEAERRRPHKTKKKGNRSGSPAEAKSKRTKTRRPPHRPPPPHMMGGYMPYPPPAAMHPPPGPPMAMRPKRSFEGFIFGCSASTFDECMQRQLFGGPHKLMPLVLQITPFNTPLFLFHHTTRTMYGVFEATSVGMDTIEPRAWARRGQSNTPFPAQVKFRYKYKFAWPLPEAKWTNLVSYQQGKLSPTLSRTQVCRLIEAFAEHDAHTAHRAAQQLIQFFHLAY